MNELTTQPINQNTTKFSKIGKTILDIIVFKKTIQPPIINKKLNDDFDLLLSSETPLLAAELVVSGYQPSPIQKQKMFSQLKKEIVKDPTVVHKIHTIFQFMPEELFHTWLLTHFKHASFSIEENKLLFTERLFDKAFCQNTLSVISDNITAKMDHIIKYLLREESGRISCESSANAKEFHNAIIIGIDFIKAMTEFISLNDTLQYKNNIIICNQRLTEKIVKISKNHRVELERNTRALDIEETNRLINSINDIINRSFNEDKQQLLEQVKKTYTLSYFNDTINKDIQHNNTIIKNELSQTAIKLLEQINSKYFNIKESPDLEQDTTEVDILYEKLPKIIKKFILIDKEYRQTLHNVEGKNAEFLMLESLENINITLDNFLITANENRLSSLSVSQRHTKAIKNNSQN
jgi:hypothetical protein